MPRGVYYNSRQLAEHDFQYRYTCETCGKQTEWIPATISHMSSLTSKKPIKEKAIHALQASAKAILLEKMSVYRQYLEEDFDEVVFEGESVLEEEYNKMFAKAGACPYCGAGQKSWYPAKYMRPSPIRAGLFFCFSILVLEILITFLFGFDKLRNFKALYVFLFVSSTMFLGFLYGYVKTYSAIQHRKKYLKQIKRQKPEIEWDFEGEIQVDHI